MGVVGDVWRRGLIPPDFFGNPFGEGLDGLAHGLIVSIPVKVRTGVA